MSIGEVEKLVEILRVLIVNLLLKAKSSDKA